MAAALGTGAALAVIWKRSNVRSTWGGRLSAHLRQLDWGGLALWLLALPARFVGLVAVAATCLFLLVPLVVAARAAEDAYRNIEREPPGTLRLSRPSKYVPGVRHVASTSTHMVLVHRCGSGTSEDPASWLEAVELVATAFGAVASQDEGGTSLGPWRPLVVPWGSVASFDLQDAGDGTAVEQTSGPPEGETEPDDCTLNWEPDGPSQVPGPKGDSVDIQYSEDGAPDADWLDKPTPNVRYIRFKAGEGEWEPSGGIRIAGSRELWYSVLFERFGLASPAAEQLAFDDGQILPSFGSHGDQCRVEVTGCASTTPFIRLCTEPNGAVCTACRRGAPCHTVVKTSLEVDEPEYASAAHVLQGIDANSALPCVEAMRMCDGRAFANGVRVNGLLCSNAMPACAERINAELNCGVANLRALATMAELNSLPLESVLDSHGIDRPADPAGAAATANLLVRACRRTRNGVAHGPAILKAVHSSDTPSSHCWEPSRARMNHAAIIRLEGDLESGVGECLRPAARLREPEV